MSPLPGPLGAARALTGRLLSLPWIPMPLLAALACATLQTTPGPPQLLVDPNLGDALAAPVGSDPRVLCEFQGGLLFATTSTEFGLWFSDGSPSSKLRLAPAEFGLPLRAVGLPSGLAVALVGGVSAAVLTTDGTLGGTAREPLAPGALGSASGPLDLLSWRGCAWFLAVSAGGELQLLRSWGTPGLHVAQSFGDADGGSDQSRLFVAGDRLFAAVQTTAGPQLLVLAEPDAPALLLGPIPGAEGGGPLRFGVAFKDRLWFAADGEPNGTELWRSDGTPQGTGLFLDIAPGLGDSSPEFLAADAQRLWFAAGDGAGGRALWTTDGTLAGTASIGGSTASGPEFGPVGTVLGDGRLLFAVAQGPAQPLEVRVSDGTPAGTLPLMTAPAVTAPAAFLPLTVAGLGVYGFAPDTGERSLWSTDGTPAGTGQLDAFGPEPHPVLPALAFALDRAWFAGDDPLTGAELWSTDGGQSGTASAVNVFPDPLNDSSDSFAFARLGPDLLFNADSQVTGRELWKTDGTPAGSTLVLEIEPGPGSSNPLGFVAIGPRALFAATTAAAGREPWVTDGTAAGTALLRDLRAGPADSDVSNMLRAGQRAVFHALVDLPGGAPQRALVFSDGTEAGTQAVLNGPTSFPSPGPEPILSGVELDQRLVFLGRAPGSGNEPWISDGTPAGTFALADLAPGPANSDPAGFARLGSKVYFHALAPGIGRSLYVTDGTPAGTALVVDSAGQSPLDPDRITTAGSQLFFAAETPQTGRELWVSDGTPAGTQLVVDWNPGPGSSIEGGDAPLAQLGDRVAYFDQPGQFPVRVLVSDGTAAGTDAAELPAPPGFELLALPCPFPIGGAGPGLLVLARSAETGVELWRVGLDGAPGALLPELQVGPASSYLESPRAVIPLGPRLIVQPMSPLVGSEPHTFQLSELGLGSLQAFGAGCTQGAAPLRLDSGGSSQIGQSLLLDLDSAVPLATCAVFVSLEATLNEFAPGCSLYLAAPLPLAQGSADAAGTLHLEAPIPSVPALVGIALTLQAVSTEPGGPLLGAYAVSNALELSVGP